jgi:Undecaprenyl-phosphate galactose phosphotransferase WbaP
MTEQSIAEIATRDPGSTLSERRRPDRVEYQSPELIALLRDPFPETTVTLNQEWHMMRYAAPSPGQSGASDSQSVLKSAAQIGKRGFDLVFAAILLAGVSSLMLAVAWMIRRDGKPALYWHKRVGAGGQSFYCIKFRTMVANSDRVLTDLLARDPDAIAEWQATQKLRRDPRITPIGRFLRKTSLDELPQLLNVLRGDMSLVGPRPIVASETRFYGNHIDDYYSIRPGITGLWQISGRSDTSYERRVQLDVWYVRNWTLWRDMVILLKTLPIVLLRRGAV